MGSVAVITGSAGLIGSEAARYFAAQGLDVVGIDNDMRAYFFGAEASTRLEPRAAGARAGAAIATSTSTSATGTASLGAVRRHGREIALVVHCAAQPSHDWAASEPFTDFDVNAGGTLNLLEATRAARPRRGVHLHCRRTRSTATRPNALPLVELETRCEIDPAHPYARRHRRGHVDRPARLHSVFGASKVAADVMVQEYGRYFGLRTAVLPRRHAHRARSTPAPSCTASSPT